MQKMLTGKVRAFTAMCIPVLIDAAVINATDISARKLQPECLPFDLSTTGAIIGIVGTFRTNNAATADDIFHHTTSLCEKI